MKVTVYYKKGCNEKRKVTFTARSIIDNGETYGFGLTHRSTFVVKDAIKKMKVKNDVRK